MNFFARAILFSWQRFVLAYAVRLRRKSPFLYAILSLPAMLVLGLVAVYPSVVLQHGVGLDGLVAILITFPWVILVFAIISCLVFLTAEWMWQITGISALLKLRKNHHLEQVASLARV